MYSEEKRVQGDRMHSSYRQTPMQTKLYSDNTERLIETAIKRLSLARINIKKDKLIMYETTWVRRKRHLQGIHPLCLC